MRQLCQWPGFDQANEDALRFVQKLVDFFTSEYLDVLEHAQYHVVYHYDERWPKLSGVPEAELEEDEAEDDVEAIDDESDSEDEDELDMLLRAADMTTSSLVTSRSERTFKSGLCPLADRLGRLVAD